jgi:hypothetical protein
VQAELSKQTDGGWQTREYEVRVEACITLQTVRMMAGTNEEQKVRTVAGSEDGGSKNEETGTWESSRQELSKQ